MARILIDANIFLEFFKTSDPSLSKHAAALSAPGVREDVFVPRQLVDEVQRNKLGAASRFIADQLKRIELPRISLPGFPEEIRKKLEGAAGDARGMKEQSISLACEYLEHLAEGSDDTSKNLAALFSPGAVPSEAVLKRARDRRERGNPPGKAGDPLGDQIIWEQFLDQLGAGPIWIITKDSDYLVKFEGRLLLNAFLVQELRACLPGVDIRVYRRSFLPPRRGGRQK